MSKKRGNKKNVNLEYDSDEEEGKVVSLIDNVDEEIQPVTKKSAKKEV
jgi:hypothetical protein